MIYFEFEYELDDEVFVLVEGKKVEKAKVFARFYDPDTEADFYGLVFETGEEIYCYEEDFYKTEEEAVEVLENCNDQKK